MRTRSEITLNLFAGKLLLVASISTALLVNAAVAEDWYRFRGPSLNGISTETGWQINWPADGPKQLWKASIGTGFSSLTVSKGHVYGMGNQNDQDTVYCFDANSGAMIWKHTYDCPLDPKFYEGGSSSTPTVDGDRIYTISKKGDVFCLDASKGSVIWSTNVAKGLELEIPTWGFAGSVLVEGDLAILNIGEAGTAFDKKTGKVVWSSGKGVSGYAAPVPFDYEGKRCVAIAASKDLIIVNVKDGKEIWRYPWKTQYDVNAADPIISDGKIFVSSGYNHGCALIDISSGKPKLLWENKNMRNHFASSVLWKGFLYGVDENELKCLTWDTSEVKWSEKSFGKGSLMMADGKIIGLSDKGILMAAEASPKEFKPVSRAQVLGGKCWSVPVLSNGKIYCRNARGDLVCVDVGAKP